MGTKKRRKYYAVKVPPELNGLGAVGQGSTVSIYRVSELLLLYVGEICHSRIDPASQINLLLVNPLPEERNPKRKRLYHPERMPRKLGLILGTGRPLPDVCLRFEQTVPVEFGKKN